MTNTGFLGTGRRPRDWELGAISGVDLPIVNEAADWSADLPTGERQRVNGVETMGCVSHSLLNGLEIYSDHTALGFFNFDDRSLAVASETRKTGNTFWEVWNAGNKMGLSMQGVWPITPEIDTWDEYYGELPATAVEQMAVFREKYGIGLQWVKTDSESMREGLKRTPLWCCNDSHAFIVHADSGNDNWKVFDSYPGGDGDFIGSMPHMRIHAAANVWLFPKKTAPVVEAPKLPEEMRVWEAGGLTRSGLHVKGRLFVDTPAKIDLQWRLRNRDPKTNHFSGGAIAPITPKQFDAFCHYDLKNNKLN